MSNPSPPSKKVHLKDAKSKTFRFLKAHALDMVITVALALATLFMYLWWYPPNRFFVERDPTLSYPIINATLSQRDTIPIWLLIVLSVPVVLILLVLLRLLATCVFKFSKDTHRLHPKALNILVLLLAYLEAFVLNLFLTTFMLRLVGQKRPNFFALCDYNGYNTALLTHNFTEYESLTVAGRPGNMSNCRGDPSDIRESMLGFPSGHASIIICAMTFIGLYAFHLFNMYSPKQNMLKGLIVFVLFLGGIIIACTRIYDHWHAPVDVLAGVIVGFGSAVLVYSQNYHEEVSAGNLPGDNQSDQPATEHDVEMGKIGTPAE